MRPQRTGSKQVDYAAVERTPPAIKRLEREGLSEFFINTDSISKTPNTKSKRKAKATPEAINNKRQRLIEESPVHKQSKPLKRLKQKKKDDKEDNGKENEVPNHNKIAKKGKETTKEKVLEVKEKPKLRKQEESQGDTTSQPPLSKQDPPTQLSSPSKRAKPSKPSKVPSKPKPASTSTALILSPHPASLALPASSSYIPLQQQQRRALQDPIVAMGGIVADEIKSTSSKACSIEGEMVLARTTKQFMKTQDHRYESLRMKFDELKQSTKQKSLPETATDEGWNDLLSQMKEEVKEFDHNLTVARKKLKEQTKEFNQNKAVLEEERKSLDKEKQRVEEEGREIEIEKRRMERKEIEKERQDIDRERWVLREDKKELETHKTRAEEETRELARRRKQNEDERVELEKEKRRLAEEHAREQKRFEAWQREVEGEKRKIEEQKRRWDDEKQNIVRQQEEVVSTLKWQVESEKQVATKSKQDNADLADKLTTATHRWAEHQEQMDREIESMVKLVNTNEKEGDTVRFFSMITGLSVVKLAANKFQCECASSNFKSRVKFEVTIRESDVEYTPLEVVGHGMPECVKESIFFMREDWPIFLCKIIASMRH